MTVPKTATANKLRSHIFHLILQLKLLLLSSIEYLQKGFFRSCFTIASPNPVTCRVKVGAELKYD